jgi:hypothetical protein
MGFFEPLQPWCAADELVELWGVENDLIEKEYIQLVESRDIDVGHEVVQVFAVPFKPQKSENRKDGACRGKRKWTSARLVRARSRGLESKYKNFKG